MIETNINVSLKANLSKAEEVIEKCCESEGLTMTLKGTLSKYPGCVHWHFKKNNQRGTLEVTFWSKTHRIWFKMQARRNADWIKKSISKLKNNLEKNLQNNDYSII